MLGNFSFGDYFKKDAIAYAWELLTGKEWFGLDPAKLYITIFEGDAAVPRDDEAYAFWREVGVPAERIFEMGLKDNFWQMGDTGPCGPCSEIFYDFGVEASETGEDKPFGEDEQRYVEIWNLVFMQFDRAGDGTLTPLPKPSIDTGMGLERVAAVMQGKLSNFETDLFVPLIEKARELVGLGKATAGPSTSPSAHSVRSGSAQDDSSGVDEKGAASLRIIADHARAATFLISDGVVPANEGRGYVLRKILRRGIRHGRLLGQEKPFMHEMVFAVRDEMSDAYPELKESAERVSNVVLAEELQFARVVDTGFRRLEEDFAGRRRTEMERLIDRESTDIREKRIENERLLREAEQRDGPSSALDELRATLTGALRVLEDTLVDARRALDKDLAAAEATLLATMKMSTLKVELPGDRAFHFYETYGLPLDFMIDAARDAGIAFDMEGFEKAKEEEQARARASWKGGSQKTASPVYRELAKTEFAGYSALRVDGARVLALVKDGVGVAELRTGDAGEVVLDATSFYADSGGQVGDVGWLMGAGHSTVVADVSGASKPVQGVWAHRVVARERIAVGDVVDTVVDGEVRAAVTRNHTGTHLLHAALREVLGRHVKQAGSSVDRAQLALRLLALCGRGRGGTRAGGGDREPPGAGQHGGGDDGGCAHRCGRAGAGRDGPVRREVWRQGARGEDWRFLDRALRRHAHARDRRDWADQISGRRVGIERRAARGGGERMGRAGRVPAGL